MNRDSERALKQIDREIEVDETKSAILCSVLFLAFLLAMFIYWVLLGYGA